MDDFLRRVKEQREREQVERSMQCVRCPSCRKPMPFGRTECLACAKAADVRVVECVRCKKKLRADNGIGVCTRCQKRVRTGNSSLLLRVFAQCCVRGLDYTLVRDELCLAWLRGEVKLGCEEADDA